MGSKTDTWTSPSRDALLRHLLGASARTPGPYDRSCLASINALSKASKAAYSWTHRIVEELRAEGWLSDGPDLKVLDAPAIYRWWAAHRKAPRGYGFHVSDPLAALKALDEARVPLHLQEGENLVPLHAMATTYYAENAYGSHLFPRRMDIYYAADLTFQAASEVDDGRFVARPRRLRIEGPTEKEVGAKAKQILLDQGAQLGGTNLRLIPAPYQLVKYERCEARLKGITIPVAPLPQVIVDLIQEGGSAAEAADLLMEQHHATARLP